MRRARGARGTRSARIPLRKRLSVRLLIASVLIAVCSVAATAWLAVTTTTRALREEQGQAIADDMDILARLSGYAAAHPDWKGVQATVRDLSARTGRRIALTTADRTPIADSAPRGASLPPRAAATVDPLRTDTFSEPGAQLSGTDPRVVGPYRLTAGESDRLDALARKRQECLAEYGIETSLTRAPSGRTGLTVTDGAADSGYLRDGCAEELPDALTRTEEKALTALQELVDDCLGREYGPDRARDLFLAPALVGGEPRAAAPVPGLVMKGETGAMRAAQSCLTQAAAPSSTRTSPRSPNSSWAAATTGRRPAGTCPRPTRRRSSARPGWCSPSPSPSPPSSPPGWYGPCAPSPRPPSSRPTGTRGCRSPHGTRPASWPRPSTTSPSAANAWRPSARPWSAMSRTNCAARSPTSGAGWRSPATDWSSPTPSCSPRCTTRPSSSSASSTTCATSPPPTPARCACTASPSPSTNCSPRWPPRTGSPRRRRA